MNRRDLLVSTIGLSSFSFPSYAQNNQYPKQPIRLLVSFPPGGPTDIFARAIAEGLSKHIAQPIIIENRPGASGGIVFNALKSAKPDGYVLALMPTNANRMSLMETTNYDPLSDFKWIMSLTGNTFAIVVRNDAPWKTFNDLAEHIKRNPGKLTYGTHGIGGAMHLGMEQLSLNQNWQTIHVPFKGSPEMLTALLGGHLDVAMDSTSAAPYVQAGRARVLAILNEHRISLWPDVPTLKEIGYNTVATSPLALIAPAGIPPDVVRILHDGFKNALEEPVTVSSLKTLNQPVIYMPEKQIQDYVVSQQIEDRKLLSKLGLLRKKQ